MAIKLYTKEYAGLLPNIFKKKSVFLRAFGGTVQVKDGVSNNDNFLELKTSDETVVIQNYDTGENVGFGTGTGSTSRFGQRKEVKSVNTQVPYENPLAIHEGIDSFTVNDIQDQVVAERLALHGEKWAEHVDGLISKALSDNASETLTGKLDTAGVTKLFVDARKRFVNNNVSKDIPWVAYVNADVYNFLIDSELAKTIKGSSSVNIETQQLYAFKGFVLVEIPDSKLQVGEHAYFTVDGVGLIGLGLSVARAIDSEDFAGVALQAAAKYGKYLPDKNKKAILKAKLTPAG